MLRPITILLSVIVTALTVLPQGVRAAEPLNVTVSGDVLTADLQVFGGYSAKLTVRFENVVGLTAESLHVTAEAVNPLDLALLQRLASVGGSIPAGFPVLLRIEPDPASGLSFSGIVEIELYTHDLQFVAGSPLRLYSSPHGGSFHDITVTHGAGSYRSGGTKGNFSDFLIAIDSRTPLAAARDKFQRLRALLNAHAGDLDASTFDELSGLLGAAESAFAAGALVAAVSYVENFADAVKSYGPAIPDIWGASHDLVNVSGKLRAAAGTLRFSLTLALNSS